jgi:hypothetical protein
MTRSGRSLVTVLITLILLAFLSIPLTACEGDGLNCAETPTTECRCGGVSEHETCPS